MEILLKMPVFVSLYMLVYLFSIKDKSVMVSVINRMLNHSKTIE